jgi:hypothetical protein
MVYVMDPATKQTKFADYDDPALEVTMLTDLHYAELTREQLPVGGWNRILLAIQEGAFENNRT